MPMPTMASPPAPHEPASDPVPGLRSRSQTRARARARVNGAIWYSGEQPPKRRNVNELRKDSANIEPVPVVKRRKRSTPRDTTEKELQAPSPLEFTAQGQFKYDASASSTLEVLGAGTRKHATTTARQPSVKNVGDADIFSLALQGMESQVNKRLYDETLALQTKVSRLEGELREERSFTEMAQNRVKQDMLMDIMKEKELRRKAEENANVMKRRFEKEIHNLKTKLTEATEKGRVERNNTLSAQASAETFRLEAEHWQIVSTTLESDIDELRGIEAEAALKRKDEIRGLPPAYGNLDDEDRFPPYSQHADGGSLEVAHLKRSVRKQFDAMVVLSLAHANDKESSVLYDLSFGLESISQRLTALLDTAINVPVSLMHSQSNEYLTQHMRAIAVTDDPKRSLAFTAALQVFDQKLLAIEKGIQWREQKPARRPITLLQSRKGAPYVAQRVLTLLLDILWRTVAACETRSTSKSITLTMSHKLPVKFTSVDEALVAALRLAFSEKCSLPALHYYLLQLETLAAKFRGLSSVTVNGRWDGPMNFAFFAKALLWLNEQVEKERELRANEAPVAGRAHDGSAMPGLEDEGGDDGDAVSSRWEGSDTTSDSEC